MSLRGSSSFADTAVLPPIFRINAPLDIGTVDGNETWIWWEGGAPKALYGGYILSFPNGAPRPQVTKESKSKRTEVISSVLLLKFTD